MIILRRINISVPTVVMPFPGPAAEDFTQDIFLYLRPESNGVVIESTLLRGLRGNPVFGASCRMVYLANMPGEFILANRIVERHYTARVRFARQGRRALTKSMGKNFRRFFGVPVERADIVGAFHAMKLLGLNEDELFNLWVPPENFFVVCGQTIKRHNDLFIVNSDIPAILHKNSKSTDIAVMIFRSSLPPLEFQGLIGELGDMLIKVGVIPPDKPIAHTFHYSKSPFEQILDGIGYLYTDGGKHLPLTEINFFNYLKNRGMNQAQIAHVIRNPIMRFRKLSGELVEENIFNYTRGDTYWSAFMKFMTRE